MRELIKNLSLPLLLIAAFAAQELSASSSIENNPKGYAHTDSIQDYDSNEGHAYEYITEHYSYDGDIAATCTRAKEKMLQRACKVFLNDVELYSKE